MERQALLVIPSVAPLARAPRQASSPILPPRALQQARGQASGSTVSGFMRRVGGLLVALGSIDVGREQNRAWENLDWWFFKIKLLRMPTAGYIKPEAEYWSSHCWAGT